MEVTSLYNEPARPAELSFGALEYRDVFRIFGSGDAQAVALRGLELRIEPGEFVALFGPSGSGKSTALQLAAGLDQPSAGDVRVFGRSLVRLGDSELDRLRGEMVAIVFQSRNLWSLLSARENVALSLRLAGRRRDTWDAVDRSLETFGLRGRVRCRPGELSGGEQQRLAIAMAAARAAPLLLADEPTAELDRDNEKVVLDSLRRLRDGFGSTVVVVTHSPRVADVVDRVIEIRDGTVA